MSWIYAVVFGIIFGFILQRVGALEYENILKTLRLQNMLIAKFMFLTVGVSAIGVYSLKTLGLVQLQIIDLSIGVLIGGLIFGVGFALSGYCPGTSIGAWAEGKTDAGFTILGGLAGVLGFTFVQGKMGANLEVLHYSALKAGDFFILPDLVLAVIYSLAIFLIVYLVNRIETNR